MNEAYPPMYWKLLWDDIMLSSGFRGRFLLFAYGGFAFGGGDGFVLTLSVIEGGFGFGFSKGLMIEASHSASLG